MPAVRPVRRSRRLSRRPPVDPSESGWEEYDVGSQCSGDALEDTQLEESSSSSSTSPRSVEPGSPGSSTDDDSESFLPQRPAHTRKKQEGHIPRPPNAFMIYRSELWSKTKINSVERDHRQISRIAGHCWNSLNDEERAPYVRMAMLAKEEHRQKYPDYKFSPVAKGKSGRRRSKEDVKARVSRSKVIAELLLEGHQGDSLATIADGMDDYGHLSESTTTHKSRKRTKTNKAKKARISPRVPSQFTSPSSPSADASIPSSPAPELPSPPAPELSPLPIFMSPSASLSPLSAVHSPQLSSPVLAPSLSPLSSSPPSSSEELEEPSPCLEERRLFVPDNDPAYSVAYEEPAPLQGMQAYYDYPFPSDGQTFSSYESPNVGLDQLFLGLLPKDTFDLSAIDPARALETSDTFAAHQGIEPFGVDLMSLDHSYFADYDYSQSAATVPNDEDFSIFDRS